MAAYHQVRYLGPQVPGAYGYLFPANDHGATAGAGGHISPSKAELDWSYFKNRESILRPQKINTFTVPLPYYSRVKHWVFGNTIFAGDIAGQVIKPGIEGILPGIICGSIAGELAGSGNLSEIEYRERVYEQIPELEYSEQLCRALESCLTVKGERQALLVLGLLSELVKIDELNKMKNATIEELNAQLSSVFS
jgi:flavin-dependent dehydrogenase